MLKGCSWHHEGLKITEFLFEIDRIKTVGSGVYTLERHCGVASGRAGSARQAQKLK